MDPTLPSFGDEVRAKLPDDLRLVRRRRVALVLAALFVVAACGGARPPAARVAAPPPPAAAPLRIGTSGDYPPFSVSREDGDVGGFDVDVLRAYARDRGRETALVRFAWPELERRLLRGDFDVAAGGITVRGDRLARAPMTATVARTDAVLVLRGNACSAFAAKGAHGSTIAVNGGGHLEKVARRTLPGAEIRALASNGDLPRAFRARDVDGIVTDTAELHELRRAGDVSGGCVAAVLSRDRKAYWVDPRDAELARDLDAWLAEREADGLLPAVRARYGLEPAAGGADALLSPAPARVADLVGRRLLLMPLVAEAKRARGAQVEDLGREAVVERRAADAACAAGLAPEPYRELARAQIAASKAVQRAVLASATGTGGPALDLDRDLRPAIDRADDELRAELVRAAPLDAAPAQLAARLRADADVPGLDDETLAHLAAALADVRQGCVASR